MSLSLMTSYLDHVLIQLFLIFSAFLRPISSSLRRSSVSTSSPWNRPYLRRILERSSPLMDQSAISRHGTVMLSWSLRACIHLSKSCACAWLIVLYNHAHVLTCNYNHLHTLMHVQCTFTCMRAYDWLCAGNVTVCVELTTYVVAHIISC